VADNTAELLSEMDILLGIHRECRGHFPCANEESVGATVLSTPPYYQKHGINITFHFAKPLTKDDVDRINAIGHWLNQNFVIRLCALLESRGVIPKQPIEKGLLRRMVSCLSPWSSKGTRIDLGLQGGAKLDLVRRLRNKFAHSSGKYNPKDAEQRKLLRRMGKVLKVDVSAAQDFPLAIDEVLEPLFKGCKAYVQAKSLLAGST
jgi:hypothetical protein